MTENVLFYEIMHQIWLRSIKHQFYWVRSINVKRQFWLRVSATYHITFGCCSERCTSGRLTAYFFCKISEGISRDNQIPKINKLAKKSKHMHIFWEKAHCLFSGHHQSYMTTSIKLETTSSLGPLVFSKVLFVTFGPANLEATGNNHTVLDSVFSVSAYILH